MLLHRLNTCGFTFLDNSIKAYWDAFKLEILAKDKTSWNEEDLTGKTNYQWKSMSYYYFLYLLILISNDIKVTQKEWSYYVTKYNLVNIKECLRCLGINFDKGLTAFGLPITGCTNGMECIEVEGTFIVEPDDLTPPVMNKVNLIELLSNPNYCINYQQTICN